MKRPCEAVVVFIGLLLSIGAAYPQDVQLELHMPGTLVGPESPFGLDLSVTNTGPDFYDTQVFVLLTLGTGSFWFYPTWVQYPPDIAWEDEDIPESFDDIWEILPVFSWPSGAGSFEGAMFMAAIVHNGALVSNLAECSFSWSEEVQPTSTPVIPTSTPTSPPTPTQPPAPTGFVYFAPGSFIMGSPSDEACRDSDETQHTVTLTNGFYMMETEVTRQMWADLRTVQATLPSDPSDTAYSWTMNHPVQYITWYESILFANLMSLQYGYTQCYYKDAGFTTPVDATNYTSELFYCNFTANGYRLPTESEWEYVCRAGTTGAFSCNEPDYTSESCGSCLAFANPMLEQYCVYCANDPDSTAEVGSKLPNPEGLYDIHGNVWEWCWDWHGPYPTGSVTDPTGAISGSYREQRGGSWGSYASGCRTANRYSYAPDPRSYYVGFRLLRTVS